MSKNVYSFDEQLANKRMNQRLVDAFPELSERYRERIEAWGEEMGPYVIWDEVLNPYLRELLRSFCPGADRELERVFHILEQLATDPDQAVVDVVITEIATEIESDRESLDRARLFMGPRMAEFTRDQLPYRVPKRLKKP